MEEKESLDFQGSRTVQTLVKHDATNYNSSLPENYLAAERRTDASCTPAM